MNIHQQNVDWNTVSLTLEGALTYSSVDAVKQALSQAAKNYSNISLDCAKISRINSAALSWMLHAVRLMQREQVTLQITHAPKDLLPLAQVSGLEAVHKKIMG